MSEPAVPPTGSVTLYVVTETVTDEIWEGFYATNGKKSMWLEGDQIWCAEELVQDAHNRGADLKTHRLTVKALEPDDPNFKEIESIWGGIQDIFGFKLLAQQGDQEVKMISSEDAAELVLEILQKEIRAERRVTVRVVGKPTNHFDFVDPDVEGLIRDQIRYIPDAPAAFRMVSDNLDFRLGVSL